MDLEAWSNWCGVFGGKQSMYVRLRVIFRAGGGYSDVVEGKVLVLAA